MSAINRFFRIPRRSKPIPLTEKTVEAKPVSMEISFMEKGPIKITQVHYKVNPIGMSYWRNLDNHQGRDYIQVILSLEDVLHVFKISKASLSIIEEHNLDINHTGEGCFWSALEKDKLYIPFDNRLAFIDTNTLTQDTIFTGFDKIWQCHCDKNEKIFSFSIKDNNYNIIGWGIYNSRDITNESFPLKGYPDECQIDKSGKWLVIKEDDYNRIINLSSKEEKIISNVEGALGHSDNGEGFILGENDYSNLPGTLDYFNFDTNERRNIYSTGIWNMGYVSLTNVFQSDICLLTTPKELISVRISTGEERIICSNLTENQDYANRSKANLCPFGEFAIWTAFVDGKLDAYIVRL